MRQWLQRAACLFFGARRLSTKWKQTAFENSILSIFFIYGRVVLQVITSATCLYIAKPFCTHAPHSAAQCEGIVAFEKKLQQQIGYTCCVNVCQKLQDALVFGMVFVMSEANLHKSAKQTINARHAFGGTRLRVVVTHLRNMLPDLTPYWWRNGSSPLKPFWKFPGYLPPSVEKKVWDAWGLHEKALSRE